PGNGTSLVGSNDVEVTVSADATAEVKTAEFTNNLSKAETHLYAKKNFENMKLDADKFSFTVTEVDSADQDASPVSGGFSETKTNGANGQATFSTIEYHPTAVGTEKHYYRIQESIPSGATPITIGEDTYMLKDGIAYDASSHTITVTVTKKADGTISVSYEGGNIGDGQGVANGVAFTNYAVGSAELKVTKTLTGRDWEDDDEFTFTISAANGTPMPADTTIHVTKADAGTKSFGAIQFKNTDLKTQDKTTGLKYDIFDYTIEEKIPAGAKDNGDGTYTLKGVTYKKNPQTVSIKVTDKGEGTLKVEYSKDARATWTEYTEPIVGAEFKNTYTSKAKVQLAATKTLTGAELEKDQFTFELTGPAGNTIQVQTGDTTEPTQPADTTQPAEPTEPAGTTDATSTNETWTKKNTAAGAVTFDPIEFIIDQGSTNTFTYKLKEQIPAGAVDAGEDMPGYKVDAKGVYYDATEYTVVVKLTDKGDGTATVTVEIVDPASEARTIEATDGIYWVTKKDGASFANKLFKTEAEFWLEKYLYGETDQEFKFTVSAAKMGDDGKLVPRSSDSTTPATDEDGVYVDNGTQQFSITKTATVDATHKTIEFDKIRYHKPGVYYYTIQETDAGTVTGDEATIDIKVTAAWNNDKTAAKSTYVEFRIVEKDQQPGKTWTHFDKDAMYPSLYNNGNVLLSMRRAALAHQEGKTEKTLFTPAIMKVMMGGALSGGEFSFSLYDAAGNQLGNSVSNDENGTVSFPPIEYTAPGEYTDPVTYTYTIKENPGDSKAIIYSDEEVTLKVTVEKNEKTGALEAKGVYTYTDSDGKVQTADPAEGQVATITNRYDTIIVKTQKCTREFDEEGNIRLGEGLAHAHYGLWMVNPNGGEDIYMGLGRNIPGKDGALYESAADGSLYYDLPLLENVAYYLLEEAEPPAGHLLDPYRTDYFTLIKVTDKNGNVSYHLANENSPEFKAACPNVVPHR
ncbi:MAG: hypothetical protein IKE22_03690, partial [Atopobiaceae bacterium]|nr:hypothetical protein [Atopobiaceae bacterium]